MKTKCDSSDQICPMMQTSTPQIAITDSFAVSGRKVYSRDAVPANSSYSKHLSTDHEDVPSDDDGKKGMVAQITGISLVLYLSLSVSQEFYT